MRAPVGAPGLARSAAFVAIVALIAAAFLPALRVPLAVALVAGLAVALPGRGRAADLRLPLAATLPAAVLLVLRTVPPPVATGPGWCVEPFPPPVLWRGAEAALAIGAVLVPGRLIGSGPRAIGLVRPGGRELAGALAVGIVIAAGALALGTTFAAPFFGAISFTAGDPRSLLPATAAALANGALEEVVYRGAMLVWLTPVVGLRGAIVLQALVFGAAHTGTDFTGSPIPVMAAVATAGAIGGIIASVRRSLVLPIVLHAAFDVPLFYVVACRLG
ncbi:MAG: lysostaphin resistance A-like protein [Chloroflexota bacterium]